MVESRKDELIRIITDSMLVNARTLLAHDAYDEEKAIESNAFCYQHEIPNLAEKILDAEKRGWRMK